MYLGGGGLQALADRFTLVSYPHLTFRVLKESAIILRRALSRCGADEVEATT